MVTKSGNRMQMVDTPGQETVVLATPHLTTVTFTEKDTTTGRPLLHVHSEGDIIITAKGRVHVNGLIFSREIGKPDPFPCASSDALKNMSPAQRAEYDTKLVALVAAKAASMPEGATKQQLLDTANRYQRGAQTEVYAQMSDSVYDDPKHPVPPPPGWKRLDPKDMPPGLNDPKLWNDRTSGYHAGLFENQQGQIVMAERGTVPYNSQNTGRYGAIQDDLTDWNQSQGKPTAQYTQGMDLSLKVQKQYGSDFIHLTGHSLGGGRAAADSAVTGVPADTYNAAGVHANTIAPYGATLEGAAGGVQNYDNPGQFLDYAHGVNVHGMKAPDPLGTTHHVQSIGPDGKPYAFKPIPNVGYNPINSAKAAGVIASNIGQAVGRHLMDTVLRSLAKEREDDAASLCAEIRS